MATQAAASSATQQQDEGLRSFHRYKITPPTYNGDYTTFEEWKFKFTAYLGLMDPQFPTLLEQAATSATTVTDADLENGASTTQEGQHWVALARELQYILINCCAGSAATVRRQHQTNNGLETWRQLNSRFSIPVGTSSIGYLTKLLKPELDERNFEETFSTWEFEVGRYERDNETTLPDNVKIAILLNETKGALQQHLQLQAGAVTRRNDLRSTILEYHRAASSYSRLQATQAASGSNSGPAPMDIGGTWWKGGKGKGQRNKGKGKGDNNKAKGCCGNGQQQQKGYGYNNHKTQRPKINDLRVPQGSIFLQQAASNAGSKQQQQRSSTNVDGGAQETADPTGNWYSEQQQYDNYWWNADLTTQYRQQTLFQHLSKGQQTLATHH